MKHQLIFLGKIKESYIAKGVTEYLSRLEHYTTVVLTTVKEKKSGRGGQAGPAVEGAQLLGAVTPGAFLIVLDSTGQQFSSRAFAERISQLEQRGIRQVSYLIGGPEGHSQEVLARADLLLSLSAMTFPHDLARLLLAEQLYRAYTIKAGEQYHK
jgi:23S rRNA (pseudouridine1915-N3)-methyltransferase